jgi:hypothetical protein
MVLPDRLRDWLLLMSLVALLAGGAIAGFPRHRQLAALVGIVWQAAFLGLYALVHTSLSAYLMYVPLAGAGLFVGALLDGAADGLKHGYATTRWARLSAACSGLSAAGGVALLLGVLRTSALLTDYPEFRDAGTVSRQFIDQAVACLASVPPGGVVNVDGLPHRIDYATSESQFVDAYVFEPYSLESVVRLVATDTRAIVTVHSTQDVHARPASISVSCSHMGEDWQISVGGL